jgi:hypothetical protein
MPILLTNMRTLPSTDFSSGGMPFAYQPPTPGFALIGLVVRAGAWIDQVAPVFAELLEDGTLGAEHQGPAFGGYGGTPYELRVSPGHVVTGIQTRSGNYVDAIRLLQTKWDGTSLDISTTRWTAWIGAPNQGGVERMERFVEPHGAAVAVGVAGRAGHYLDNLTLVSAELVRVTGTAVGAVGKGNSNRGSRGASSNPIAAG